MADEPKDQRIPIMMTAAEVDAIDTWRHDNRIASRAEAMRRLVQMGLGLDRTIMPAVEAVNDAHNSFIELMAVTHGKGYSDEGIAAFQASVREVARKYRQNFTKASIWLGQIADIKSSLSKKGMTEEGLAHLREMEGWSEKFGQAFASGDDDIIKSVLDEWLTRFPKSESSD